MKSLKQSLRGQFAMVACALLVLVRGVSSAAPPDATTAMKSGTDAEDSYGRTVVLAPYIVTAMRVDERPWRYGSLPGLEILTRASDEDTRHLLVAYLRSWWTENKVFPKNWLQGPPVPYTIIVDDTDPTIPGQPDLSVAPLVDDSATDLLGWDWHEWAFSSTAVKVAPVRGWIRAGDLDTTALSANLYYKPSFVHAPTGLDRLDRCVPPLPPWLMEGLVGRFGLFEMRTNMVVVVSHDVGKSSAAIFRGARWISTEETERLKLEIARKHRKTEIPFIPLAQFFRAPPHGESRLLWESEAGLFVRWALIVPQGLFGPKKKENDRRQAFLQFVEWARYEPVTEKMFIKCFGCGSKRWNNYLLIT